MVKTSKHHLIWLGGEELLAPPSFYRMANRVLLNNALTKNGWLKEETSAEFGKPHSPVHLVNLLIKHPQTGDLLAAGTGMGCTKKAALEQAATDVLTFLRHTATQSQPSASP